MFFSRRAFLCNFLALNFHYYKWAIQPYKIIHGKIEKQLKECRMQVYYICIVLLDKLGLGHLCNVSKGNGPNPVSI